MDRVKVLIVEDEGIVALEISRTLKEMGYRVVGTCRSAKDTLGWVEKELPDIVLMDIHIQGDMDGIDLAIHLHRENRLPVIFLTSHSDNETLERAKLAEPYGYLSKSFYYKDIRTTIETALNSHQMKLLVEEQEELLSLTLGNIDEGIITTDGDGAILFYNKGASRLFGLPSYKKGEISTKLPEELRLLTSSGEVLELPLSCRDLPKRLFLLGEGGQIPLDCRINHYRGPGGGGVERVYLFRDVRDHLKMQEVSARLSSLVEYSEDAIVGISPTGEVLSWNRGAESILGFSQEEALGKQLADLVPHFSLPDWGDLERHRAEGVPVLEGLHRHPRGETKTLQATLSAVRNNEGNTVGFSFIARDVSYRIQLERQVIQAEDRERSRIGRDLHDSLGQKLTGISLKIKALENSFSRGDSDVSRNIAMELGGLIKSAIGETRELSRGLVPEILRDEGFLVALRDLALYYERVMGIKVECITEPLEELDKSVETQLYHIAQESMNNAVKHGGADQIMVKFYQAPEGPCLSIRDNGGGFDRNTVTKGLGLNNMRYRADIINGRLNIESVPGEGTVVECILM